MGLAARWRDYHPTYTRNLDVARAASLLSGMRKAVAIVCVVYTLALVALVIAPTGSPTGGQRIAVLLIAAVAIALAAVWWRGPWPSVTVSLCFVLGAEATHTVLLLFLISSPMLALYGSLWFALIGEYLTLVHGRFAVGMHCLWTLFVIAYLTTVALRADHPTVAVTGWVAAALVATLVAIPFLRQLSTEWLRENSRRASAMADRDSLTDLLNHRGMRAAVPHLLAEAFHSDVTLVGIVIDLDRFKRINDTFGHHRGDAVLRRVADRLAAAVRRGAVVARIGGEEFVVFDTLADPGMATTLAERLRAAIPDDEDDIEITGSVGVAVVPLTDVSIDESHRLEAHNTIQDILRRADQAMYEAKRLGGNRVMAFEVTPDPGENHPFGSS